jgi:hypothetical protein
MTLAVQGFANPQVFFEAEAIEAGGRLLNLPEGTQIQTEQAADKDLAHHPVCKQTYGPPSIIRLEIR